MVRYWAMAPVEYKDKAHYYRVWQYDRDNGIITIGWDVGEPESVIDLEARYGMYWPEESNHGFKMLYKFWYEIRPGDRIIARAGRKRIVGVGTASAGPYVDENHGRFAHGSNCLPVDWEFARERVFPDMVFPRYTIVELDEAKFMRLTRNL